MQGHKADVCKSILTPIKIILYIENNRKTIVKRKSAY